MNPAGKEESEAVLAGRVREARRRERKRRTAECPVEAKEETEGVGEMGASAAGGFKRYVAKQGRLAASQTHSQTHSAC